MKKQSKVVRNASIATVVLMFLGLAYFSGQSRTVTRPDNGRSFAETTAMVTIEGGRSGGTAVILHSEPSSSILLTNKHVCELIQGGGEVKTIHETHPVAAYKVYPKHDLCLIQVMANLGINTTIAKNAPDKYSPASISGHPNLLPPILTRGYFSDEMTIQVMVGTEPCDGTEDDEMAMMCLFMGVRPIIRTFASQVVSATIMAGSSGSGIFNSDGEVAALVFAGNAQGLSYAFIVPHAFVYDFVTHQDQYEWVKPQKGKPKRFFSALFQLEDACANKGNFPGQLLVPETCKALSFQSIGRR